MDTEKYVGVSTLLRRCHALSSSLELQPKGTRGQIDAAYYKTSLDQGPDRKLY